MQLHKKRVAACDVLLSKFFDDCHDRVMYELFGYAASIFAMLAFAPQVIRSVRSQSTRDLSLLMLIIALLGNFCWLVNGYGTQNMPLLLSGTVISLLLIPLISMKLRELLKGPLTD